jgi:hypothetical protein
MCHGETFHGPGIWDVENLILVGALFLLDGRKRRVGNKKEKKRKKSP